MQSLKCPSCGGNIPSPSAKFCSFCGTALVPSASIPQPQPTAASLLELGKNLLGAGNVKEADNQFILALQFEADNKEAWFWRGVCNSYETEHCWKQSGFNKQKMIGLLADTLPGKSLLRVGPKFANEDYSTIYLDAALLAKNNSPSRRDWLDACESALLGLTLQLWSLDGVVPEYNRKDIGTSVRALGILFDRLGPDQPSDVIKGDVYVRGVLDNGRREVREKPSYWRKYIQRINVWLSKGEKRVPTTGWSNLMKIVFVFNAIIIGMMFCFMCSMLLIAIAITPTKPTP